MCDVTVLFCDSIICGHFIWSSELFKLAMFTALQVEPAPMATTNYSKSLRDCRGRLVRNMKMNPAFISDMMRNDIVSSDEKRKLDEVTYLFQI